MTAAWDGLVCSMCHGTGEALWRTSDSAPHLVRCPACNRHGREPAETDESETSFACSGGRT